MSGEQSASSLRVVSYGGGVQSTALLVLAAQGKIDFRTFLFANVGDDAEPDTRRYLAEHAAPYAKAHGIAVHSIHRLRLDGTRETLTDRITSSTPPIPVRKVKDGPPMTRSCTMDFKIRVVSKWLRQHGASEANPASVAIGFSTDEVQRATNTSRKGERLVFPLLDLGMDRSACEQLIRDAGLPVPPKSSCYYCPFHSLEAWRTLLDDHPDRFAAAVAMEREMSERHGPIFLTRYGKPLDQVVTQDQGRLDFDEPETCDAWSCFT